MDMFYLEKLVKVVLPDEASLILSKLLRERDVNSTPVIEYLLGEVDRCYILGILSFEDAAEFYNQMSVPRERVAKFPQLSSVK